MKNFKTGIWALLLLGVVACQNEDLETISDTTSESIIVEKKANGVLGKITAYTNNGTEFVKAKVLKGVPPETKGRLDFRVTRNITLPPNKLQSFGVSDTTEDVTGVYIQVKNASGKLSKNYLDITFEEFEELFFEKSSASRATQKAEKKASKLAAKLDCNDDSPFDDKRVILDLSKLFPGTKFTLVYSVHDDKGNVSRTKESNIKIVPFGGNKRIAGTWALEKIQLFSDSKLVSEDIVGEIFEERFDEVIECADGRTLPFEYVGQESINRKEITFYENGTFKLFYSILSTQNVDYYSSMEACALIPSDNSDEIIAKGKWRYTNSTGKLYVFTETVEDKNQNEYDLTDPNDIGFVPFDSSSLSGRLRLDNNDLKIVSKTCFFGSDEHTDNHEDAVVGAIIENFKKK